MYVDCRYPRPTKSGWRNSNPRPLVPQTSALTKLSYIPYLRPNIETDQVA